MIFPEEIPVIPPDLPALQWTTIPIIDIGAFISAVLSNMPKAPSNLQAEFKDCMVRLAWIDNADNETHYNIWMQRLGGPPQLIKTVGGSPSTGPAWTEFRAPAFGIYGFWVEAVNGLGSQPSQMKGLARRSLVLLQDVSMGDRLSERNLGLRRPGDGLPPAFIHKVYGRKATKPLPKGHVLQIGDFQ